MKAKVKIYTPKDKITVPPELIKEMRKTRSVASRRAICDYCWSEMMRQNVVPEEKLVSAIIREKIEKLPLNKNVQMRVYTICDEVIEPLEE